VAPASGIKGLKRPKDKDKEKDREGEGGGPPASRGEGDLVLTQEELVAEVRGTTIAQTSSCLSDADLIMRKAILGVVHNDMRA
jgi:hypothetical protein